MKSIIKNITLPALLAAVLPLFTACSDSMEVGDTLHPTAQEDYSAKAYIVLDDAVQQSTAPKIVKTPTECIVPEYKVEVYAKLSRPADADVTVTVEPSAELTAANLGDCKALAADAFTMERGTVTIKAGQTQSEEPIVAALQNNDAVNALQAGETGKLTFAIKSVSGGVATSANHNSFNAYATCEFNNIKENGSIEGKTAYDNTSFSVFSDVYGESTSFLNDGKLAVDADGNAIQDSYESTNDWGNAAWTITFDEEQTVSAVAIWPAYYYSWNYSVADYNVLTSTDGTNWTDNGRAVKNVYPDRNNPQPAVAELISPMKAKYVRIVVNGSYYGTYYYAFASEIQLFK